MSDANLTINPGRLPIPLTSEEAIERAQAPEAEDNSSIAVEDLPVVVFPIRFKLQGEVIADHTGEIGGILFKDGVSVAWHPYRRVNHFAAAMFPVIDVATGIVVSPLSEGTTYRVEGKHWNPYQPLPDHCLEPAVNEEADHGCTEEEAEEGLQEGLLNEAGDGPSHDEIVLAVTNVIRQLRPGHKEDFGFDELPLPSRLSAIAGFDVSPSLRDEAWGVFRNRFDADNSAFALPVGDGVKAILEGVLRLKGARFLRQAADGRGIQNPGRSGVEVLEALIASGITEDEARKLV